jgi:glutathione S-transferase
VKFYNFKTAPNPMKVRSVIIHHKIDIEIVDINLLEQENLKHEYLAINPKGTVPALLLDDGQILLESLAISTYLDSRYGEISLFGSNQQEKAFVFQKCIALEDFYIGVQEVFRNSLERYKNRGLPGSKPYEQIPALIDRGNQRIENNLELIENDMKHSLFLANDQFSYADITLYIYLQFAKRVLKKDFSHYQNIMNWETHLSKEQSIQELYDS